MYNQSGSSIGDNSLLGRLPTVFGCRSGCVCFPALSWIVEFQDITESLELEQCGNSMIIILDYG